MRLRAVLVLVLTIACAMSGATTRAQQEAAGVVYTATNAPNGNSVLVLSRSAQGELALLGSFSTGGLGTGTGLGNQGGLILSPDGDSLLVVNAGSNEVSVFEVLPNGLRLTEKVASGGKRPISLTLDRDVLYVLNAGGGAGAEDNITAFKLTEHGKLAPLPSSTRPLSGVNTGPAEISFNRNGTLLVVTEKDTNRLDIFRVDRDGYATGPFVEPSSGTTPFGFAFGTRNEVFVSEAFGGAANASALSSYKLERDGELESISSSVPTTETAACWAVVTRNGRFVYVTNTGSASISGYSISVEGELSLLPEDGKSAVTGAGPIDAAFSRDDKFLFTLNSSGHNVTSFRVGEDGGLTPVSALQGLPAGANGLAAR